MRRGGKAIPLELLTDDRLSNLSPATVGIYLRVMILLHRSKERGRLLLAETGGMNGLAVACGSSLEEFSVAVSSLVERGVLAVEGSDAVLCPRMRALSLLSETRRAAGMKGGNPLLCRAKGLAAAAVDAVYGPEVPDDERARVVPIDSLVKQNPPVLVNQKASVLVKQTAPALVNQTPKSAQNRGLVKQKRPVLVNQNSNAPLLVSVSNTRGGVGGGIEETSDAGKLAQLCIKAWCDNYAEAKRRRPDSPTGRTVGVLLRWLKSNRVTIEEWTRRVRLALGLAGRAPWPFNQPGEATLENVKRHWEKLGDAQHNVLPFGSRGTFRQADASEEDLARLEQL